MERIAKLNEFLKESPDDSFLEHALALEYIKSGNDEKAGKLFYKILEREPGYVGSYYHLGKLLERKNDVCEALKVYKKGMEIALSKDDRHSYNELFAAYEELKDETE
jgi:tetratricopeptide (TPR) repeat protein